MTSPPLILGKSASTTEKATFNIYLIVSLSVAVALVVVLGAVVVCLVVKNRRLAKHQPKNPGEVFSNMALSSDAVINLEEEVSHSNDVHLETATTDTSEQTRQDPGPVYEEARRPLPPIPVAHDATREEDTRSFEMQSQSAAKRANFTFNNVASATRAGNEVMRLSPKNGHDAAPAVLPGAGRTYFNTFLAPEQAGDSSYYSINSTQAQTSGAKQQGNNRKRNKEGRVLYQNACN